MPGLQKGAQQGAELVRAGLSRPKLGFISSDYSLQANLIGCLQLESRAFSRTYFST